MKTTLLSSSNNSWWNRPVRMIRRDIEPFQKIQNIDLRSFAPEAKTLWNANVEWVNVFLGHEPDAPWVNGEIPSKSNNFQILKDWISEAKKVDVKLISYLNMHWFKKSFREGHEDWEQRFRDGTLYGDRYPLYGNGITMCVNSPWRDWAFQSIQEILYVGFDGVFLDGPLIFPEACYCEHCRKQFAKENSQAEMPEWEDWGNPLWGRLQEFRKKSWVAFMRDAQKAAQAVHSEAAIWINGGGYDTFAMDIARCPFKMESVQTFNSAEEFYYANKYDQGLFDTLHMSRFLSASSAPGLLYIHHMMSGWHYTPLPAGEIQTAIAQTVAGGSHPWIAVNMKALHDDPENALASAGSYATLHSIEDYLSESRSAAEIGVLISNQTLYYYNSTQSGMIKNVGSGVEVNLILDQGDGREKKDLKERRKVSAEILNKEIKGCFEVLTRMHLPFQILWDEHLFDSERLAALKILILPNMACLSQEQRLKIRHFVEQGGILISTFESGLYDASGNPTDDATWMHFLGIQSINGGFKPSALEDYMQLQMPLEEFQKGRIFSRPFYSLKVKLLDEASVFACPMTPNGIAYMPVHESQEFGTLWAVSRGKGQVVGIGAAWFDHFKRYTPPDHQALFRSLLRKVLQKDFQIETNAPESVAIELRQNTRGLQLHIVNATGYMIRPIRAHHPLQSITIKLQVQQVTRVTSQVTKQEILFENQIGGLLLTVPQVNAYELLTIEYLL